MKKATAALIVAIIFICTLGGASAPQPDAKYAYAGKNGIDTSAAACALLETKSNTLLFSQHADKRLPMASTTKIMTAVIVLESGNIDEEITITEASVGIEGSSMYLKQGERFTKRELLYGLMLQSGNDAATALATAADGGMEGFVRAMNAKAKSIGLENTSFKNPHGLSADGHYTTAKELAILTAYALQVEGFTEISGTKSIVLEGESHDTRYLFNHNKLLKSYDGMIAGKTGYTMASGRCLVTAACRGDMTLVAVTLDDRNDWADHMAMHDYGFSAFKTVKACDKDEKAAIPVVGGKESAVLAKTKEELWLCIPTDAEITRIIDNSPVQAPVKVGAPVACIRFFENEMPVAEIPLYAIYTVRRK